MRAAAVSFPLAEKYARQLGATLGHAGRMISLSKSGYHKRNRSNVAIYNANVCVAAGKIWEGDLDLTLDEPKLAALSEQTGAIIYVLYEGDGRFRNEEQPILDRAVYSVTPSGHTTFQHTFIERTKHGSLQLRPPEPDRRPRWQWSLLWHRPRLLRVWQIDRRRATDRHPGYQRSTLVYVGARDQGATPLLVLVCFHAHGIRTLGLEATFYPSQRPPRHAPRPLLSLKPTLKLRRLDLWIAIIAWPGYMWELRTGWRVKPRWR